VEHDDVEVAFDHNGHACLLDGGLGGVQPEERAALAEERRVGRVHVLGRLGVVAQSAPAEPNNLPHSKPIGIASVKTQTMAVGLRCLQTPPDLSPGVADRDDKAARQPVQGLSLMPRQHIGLEESAAHQVVAAEVVLHHVRQQRPRLPWCVPNLEARRHTGHHLALPQV
jgi:hypothetical protein